MNDDGKRQNPPPSTTRLARLWQPGRGIFWAMVAFNVLSSAMAWAMRVLPLNTTGLLLVGVLALSNAVAGLWLAARLWRGD